MFETLADRLGHTLRDLRGVGRLSEDNIQATLRDVRRALLEADVALPVIKTFIDQVRARAMGVEVTKSLTPGQALIKVVHEELVGVLGRDSAPLNLNVQPPAVILLAGLQGSGKTTTAAKLARWLRERQDKQVTLVSTDVYRPAAMEQLERLAAEVKVDYFAADSDDPVEIAKAARAAAQKQFKDVLLVDTAGRLHIDDTLMDEVKRLEDALKPVETLFVVDCMAGQDAAKAAAAFGEALPLTGTVLTKTDGDARGGAALSVTHITKRPIKFMGTGEKTAALEVFHPDRIASRILGMGDVLSLVEEAEQKVDRRQAEKLARKLKKGGFDLEDFREQLTQMMNMGGLSALLDKLPGAASMPNAVRDQVNDKELRRQIAIINSMTARERRRPAIINGSRRRRIAAGSGNEVQHVNRLLKQFAQMQKMMKKASRGGMAKMMKRMKGRMPPGMMGP